MYVYRIMSKFSGQLDNEKLIHEVKKYSELYNTNHKKFKDIDRKEDVWEEIASVVNRPGS